MINKKHHLSGIKVLSKIDSQFHCKNTKWSEFFIHLQLKYNYAPRILAVDGKLY